MDALLILAKCSTSKSFLYHLLPLNRRIYSKLIELLYKHITEQTPSLNPHLHYTQTIQFDLNKGLLGDLSILLALTCNLKKLEIFGDG